MDKDTGTKTNTNTRTLKDFEVGDWFFNEDGKLMHLESVDDDGWGSYTDGHTSSTSNLENTVAYDLTVHNKMIADNVQWYFREFSKKNLLTAKTANQLSRYMRRLMELDEKSDEYTGIYSEMDRYKHELEEHMSHFL
jgi:hypothetical protein